MTDYEVAELRRAIRALADASTPDAVAVVRVDLEKLLRHALDNNVPMRWNGKYATPKLP